MNLERNIEFLVSKGQDLIAYAATSVAQTSVIRDLAQYNSRAVVWFQGTFAGEKIVGTDNVAFLNKVLGNFAFIYVINSFSERYLTPHMGFKTKFVIRAVMLTGAVLTSTAVFGGSLPVIGGIAGVYLVAKTYAGKIATEAYNEGFAIANRGRPPAPAAPKGAAPKAAPAAAAKAAPETAAP